MDFQLHNGRENFYKPFLLAALSLCFMTFCAVILCSLFLVPLFSPALCTSILYGPSGALIIATGALVGIFGALSAARSFDWFWIMASSVALGLVVSTLLIRYISPVFMDICKAEDALERQVAPFKDRRFGSSYN